MLAALKEKIDEILGAVLRCDSDYFVPSRLSSIDKEKSNMNDKIDKCTQTKKNHAGKMSASLMNFKQVGYSKITKLLWLSPGKLSKCFKSNPTKFE